MGEFLTGVFLGLLGLGLILGVGFFLVGLVILVLAIVTTSLGD